MPLNPQLVVVIDIRLDLEPAVALALPIIAYSYFQENEPWAPYRGAYTFIAANPIREVVLALELDLILRTDLPGTDMWPIDELQDIAPVLPVDFELSWQENLARLSDWLDRREHAHPLIAQ